MNQLEAVPSITMLIPLPHQTQLVVRQRGQPCLRCTSRSQRLRQPDCTQRSDVLGSGMCLRLGLAVRKQGTQLLRCPLVLPQATRTAPRRRNAGYRTPTGSQPTSRRHLPCHQPPALRECQGWRCSRRPPAGTCAAATSPNARASWAWAKAQGSVRFRVRLWVQVMSYDCPPHALNQPPTTLGTHGERRCASVDSSPWRCWRQWSPHAMLLGTGHAVARQAMLHQQH